MVKPPPVSHPSLPPLLGAFKQPPRQGKKVPLKTRNPPPPENNCNLLRCTFVVDSSACDNFNLIMQTNLEVFWLFVV